MRFSCALRQLIHCRSEPAGGDRREVDVGGLITLTGTFFDLQ